MSIEFLLTFFSREVSLSQRLIARERLRHHEWQIDLEPSHPKMGILVKELSEQAYEIVEEKR